MALNGFDPYIVGSLECQWWQAHNAKNKPLLLSLLKEQHVALYGLDSENSLEALKYLFDAVSDHDIRDWKSATEKAAMYYTVIKDKAGLSFDPQKAAELEVGWWKLHDELEYVEDKTSLANAFSLLYSEVFSIAKEQLQIAGELKAQATYEHDLAEDPNTPPQDIGEHWGKAESLLINFYQELQRHIK